MPRFTLIFLACLLPAFLTSAAENFSSVYLNEILPAGGLSKYTVKDEDGDDQGWIELHNPGVNVVNLSGCFLTDTPDDPTKWRFPRVAIAPGKYLLVFASGKDRATNGAALHTNFRLRNEGGFLALASRSTNVLSSFGAGYPPSTYGLSFGRVRGEPAITGFFQKPTPGKANSTSGKGFASEVSFSRRSRSFVDPFELELSCPDAGTTIRYTLDGSLPSQKSSAYEGPLLVTNSLPVRARAYREGFLPGPPVSETFLRLHTNTLTFNSSLPLLVIDTFGHDVPVSAQGSLAHLSLHEIVNGRSSLTNPPSLATRAGIRVRGSTSAGMPQPGFAVEFIDDFNQERDLPLLGLPADSDWILYAPNGYDPVLFHNPFIHQLSRDMGRYSPRTRFVEVFLVNGSGRIRDAHYAGLYVLEEKIKIGRNRVNIDKLGADDLQPPNISGGYLLKFDRLGPGEGGVSGYARPDMAFVEPREVILSMPQRAPQMQYIERYLQQFEKVLEGEQWKDPTLGYRAYLDVEAAIDFHVLEVLSGNVDAIVLSTYFYKPRNGKITFGPHWDFDRALGSTDGRDENPRMWDTGPYFSGVWWPRLFTDLDFWQLWIDRWQELGQNHFSVTNLHWLIDQLADELRDAQPRQYRRWGFDPRGGSYQSEVQHMKDWLSNRVDFINGQLTPPPQVNIEQGNPRRITFSGRTNDTIYFTTDGRDPRLPQGSVAPDALIYSNTIRWSNGLRITARAYNPKQRQRGGPPLSSQWSGPVRVSE